MEEENYTNLMLKEMREKFNIVIEITTGILQQLENKANQSDLEEVKTDIKVIKYATKQTNKIIGGHENRITKLKANRAT